MLLARILVLFLAPAGCASLSASPQEGSAADPFGFPAPSGPLVLPQEDEQVPLSWLVQELARLTGQELVFDPQVRQLIQNSAQPLLTRTPVPADEVYEFVEAILAHNDFFVAPVKGGTRPMLGIYAPTIRAGSRVAAKAVVVAPTQLDALERHPALLCQMLIAFENVDTRQLQTQLRQLMVDQTGITQVVPCGDRALLLQGTSTTLVGLARVLAEVDEANVGRLLPPQPSPGDPPQSPPADGPKPPQGPPR
jgi:hypothetical protein